MRKFLQLPAFLLIIAFSANGSEKDSGKNIFQIEHHPPVRFVKMPEGVYFADFGKDAFGTLELSYKATKADTLIIRLGEKILNGRIDHNPGGTIRFAEVKLAVSPAQINYTLRLPDKRKINEATVLLPDSFGVIMPFRYAEISGGDHAIQTGDLHHKAYSHAFDESQSDFTSSDSVLNQVWALCKYSIKATSFTGMYVDGDRERISYEADAYINQLGHYCTDCSYDMARNTIERFMFHPTWPTEWLLHTALMIYQDYCYTGDTGLMEKYYDKLKEKTLIGLVREDGLISTMTGKVTGKFMQKIGFADTTKRIREVIDWPPGQKDTGWKLANAQGERDGYELVAVNTVVNCFFYENMQIMAEIAGILHKSADKQLFETMTAKVKSSVNQKLFNREKGVYTDGEGSLHSSLHANMMALAFGLVPLQHIKSVTAFIKSRGMACSVYGAQYLLEGLYKAGEAQYALDLMRSTTDRSWYNMIRVGSTITMEAWDMKYKPNSDWNHAWGAVPANLIPRGLWGIQPKTPGYGRAIIHPQMGNLTFSTIKVPTRLGQIIGKYDVPGSDLQLFSFILPPKMTGEFFVTTSTGATILLNGKKINNINNAILLKPGTNKIEIKAKSN